MKIILFIPLLLASLFTPLLGGNVVAAACTAGAAGTHGPASFLTGQGCGALRNQNGSGVGPGQFSDVLECIGTTGCRYFVTYCATIGTDNCEEKFPEKTAACPDPRVPPGCNQPDPATQSNISKIFGQIIPPISLQYFGFGSAGISKFLSNFIVLIYTLATLTLIFMLLWGAFDWMTSGGDKEKLAAAQKKIINAIIGILLFAVAFAIIQVLGQFTGFTFFKGQK